MLSLLSTQMQSAAVVRGFLESSILPVGDEAKEMVNSLSKIIVTLDWISFRLRTLSRADSMKSGASSPQAG